MSMSPICTAPKDGGIVLGYWREAPVFMAWIVEPARLERSGIWPLRRKRLVAEKGGWRVLMHGPDGQFYVHGNYAPFSPSVWMAIPDFPDDLYPRERRSA